jgi:hypothetical protein
MNRAQILWLQCWIALSGGVFWALPPVLNHWKYALIVSTLWALLCLTAIWVESLENWAHRLTAFFGFLLFTVEGILGLLGLTAKGGMLIMAFLHGCTFFLSIAGRYLSKTRRRRRPSFETLAQQALEKIESEKEA